MTIALMTPPAFEPLGLGDVKAHLRIDHDHEDDLLMQIVTAARQYTEFACGTKLLTQAWRQYAGDPPKDDALALHIHPVQSIAAITLFDEEGMPSVLAEADYRLRKHERPQIVSFDCVDLARRAANGLEIDLVAGLADNPVEVPEALKRAILLLVAHWYEFRGAIAPQDQPVSLPPGFDALIQQYRQVRL